MRPSNYNIPVWRDVKAGTKAAPGIVSGLMKAGREMAAQMKQTEKTG